ncbi:MAG: hypothetical protein ACFCUT_02430 [Kiloniellaceae bacterium]
MKSGWAALVAAMLLPMQAAGQTSGNILADIEKIGLYINDQVKDGCWPRPQQSRRAVELELVRSNLAVEDSSIVFLTLYALGSETAWGSTPTGVCIVSYTLNLRDCVFYYPSYLPEARRFRCVTIWEGDGHVSGAKVTLQQSLTDQFVELTRSFLLDLEKDRRGIVPEQYR